MDAFGDLLRGVRANGAMFGQSIMSPPWSLRFDDGAALTLFTMLRGEGWITPADGEPQQLRPGDVAVTRGPAPRTVSDSPDTAPQVVIHDGTRCTSATDGTDIAEAVRLGAQTWGENPQGRSVLLSAAYQMRGDVSDRLLSALPPMFVLEADSGPCPVLDLLSEEIAADRPGQQVVVDRMLDWLLVCTLRDWFDRPEADPPAWYRALGDTVVGQALRAMHDEPDQPWTVASLATRVGVSRAALARRFSALVGEPPLRYLTGWRMTLAADLLRQQGATVAAVAKRVGYTDSFAFSTAFKRVRGVSPSLHRVGGP